MLEKKEKRVEIMKEDVSRTIGFFCTECFAPGCRDITLTEYMDLAENGKSISYKCPICKTEPVTITPKRDKCEITFKCWICDETHKLKLKNKNFWRKDLNLICHDKMMEIFCIGDREDVLENLMETGNKILNVSDEDEENKTQLLYVSVLSKLSEKISEGNVHCNCGSHNAGVRKSEDGGVELYCKDCGAKKVIYPTEENNEMIKETETIKI